MDQNLMNRNELKLFRSNIKIEIAGFSVKSMMEQTEQTAYFWIDFFVKSIDENFASNSTNWFDGKILRGIAMNL